MNKVQETKPYLEEANKIHQHHIDLLIEMRHLCGFTQNIAAEELSIERSDLTRYENNNIHMSLVRFIRFRFVYYHYIMEHNIEISAKMRKLEALCNPF